MLFSVPTNHPSMMRKSPDMRAFQQPSPVPSVDKKSMQDVTLQSLLLSNRMSHDLSRRQLPGGKPEEPVYIRGTYRPNSVTLWRGGSLNMSRRTIPENANFADDINELNASHLPPVTEAPVTMRRNAPTESRAPSVGPELSLPPLNLGDDDINQEGPPSPIPAPSRPQSYFAGPNPFQPPAWMAGPFMTTSPPNAEGKVQQVPLMMMMPMPLYMEPKSRPDAVGLEKYDPITRLWMEKNDIETVRKSLLASPISMELNTSKSADAPYNRLSWNTAKARERGRNLRQMKRQLDQLAALVPGSKSGRSLSTASYLGSPTGNENEDGHSLCDQLMASPTSNKEMLLLFRVSGNWKDLAWVLFDGIQSDSETIRMIEDIRLKHPRQLREQVK